ncbi:MAG: hypothetical protein KA436_10690 [Oligoflexales bacterium]|nr:hypothetical protein [Oligoflexales bacterium]
MRKYFMRCFLWIGFLSGLMLSACGPFERMLGRPPIEEGDGIFHREKTGTPIVLQLQDPQCSSDDALDDLGLIHIWLRNSKTERVELTEFDLTGVSGRGLRSEAIEVALHGSELKTDIGCTIEDGKERCLDLKKMRGEPFVEKGSELNICRKGGSYHADSLENTALAMVAGVHPAWKFLKSTGHPISKPGTFKKVILLVHPDVTREITMTAPGEDVIVMRSQVDNAFWTELEDEGKFIIAAVPQSKKYGPAFDTALWKMPAVFSHEFAHHVFYLLAPSLIDPLSPVAKAVRGLNEAFADMLAHLVFNSGNHNQAGFLALKGEKGLDRAVGSPVFDDQSRKVLTSDVICAAFSSCLVFRSLRDLEESSRFSDPHMWGAVVAYGLNKVYHDRNFILDQKNPDTSLSMEQKIVLDLMKWVSRMGSSYREQAASESLRLTFQSNEEFLERAVMDAVQFSGSRDNMKLLGFGDRLDRVDLKFLDERFLKKVFPVYASKYLPREIFPGRRF